MQRSQDTIVSLQQETTQLSQTKKALDDRITQFEASQTALRTQLDAWLKETGAKFPTQDTQFDAAQREARWESLKTQGQARLEKQHASYLKATYTPKSHWWGSAPRD